MRRLFILFLWLASLPIVTRGQTVDDADLSELLQPIQATSLYYWYDDDANRQTVSIISGTYSLDVASLSDGIHTIHYQVVGADGGLYDTKSRVFLKLTDAYGLTDINLEGCKLKYWFDTDAGNIQTVNSLSGIYTLDVASLSDGLHTLHYMVLDANGTVCSIMTDVFYKMESVLSDDILGHTVTATNIAYWFDDDATTMQTSNGVSGIYVLDVSALSDGLHTLHYHVVGDDGSVYGTTTRMFLKNEAQHEQPTSNGIVKYTYWINNSCGQTITFDEAVNPYTLMTLLPVQTQPIRSSSFHFQIDDGIPTIYAKNDFRIRFYDARGEFVDNFFEHERSFIDYGVSQQVVAVGELQATQTFNRMGNNEIRWYTVNLERGDSVALKTDKACGIQLFSPSGKEEYNASGARSVKWDGCHASETGTYYLALHDVTAQQGNTITLDYQHIDKYALLRQDVSVVGNGGCSTITFEGNGFRDLYAVDLINAQGDIINHIDIGHESDATTSVTFDFSGVMVGDYNAIFHFAEEDLVKENILSVVEPIAVELETALLYSSAYAERTGKTTYVLKIVNKGNMTAYGIPIAAQISSQNPNGILKILIYGLDLVSLYESINVSEMPEKEKKELLELSEQVGDTHYFSLAADMLSLLGNFIVNIPPQSIKEIKFEVYTTESINAQFSVPQECSEVICPGLVSLMEPARFKRKTIKDGFCCHHGMIECWINRVSYVSSALSLIPAISLPASAISCITGALSNISSISAGFLCDGEEPFFKDFMSTSKTGFSLFATIASCIAPFAKAEKAKEILTNITKITVAPNAVFSEVDCSKNKNFNCETDSHVGGTSNPVASYDPNEIFGYEAESGSHAVKDNMRDVYYTIEFENDPEVATASAHDICVTDQLDATMFDLSTFAPTRVQIGSKSAELNGDKNFVTTIDMRPEINAIAQVGGTFDESTGLAQWHISSLDPMTMEPINDPLDGVLPVNTDGSGIGQVSFDIALKDGLAHGTEVPNQATIVFDTNEPILTPVWTNVIDRIAPESHITNVELVGDSDTATVSIEATDDGSGPWRYDVYVQYGTGAWFLAAENVPVNSTATVKLYSDIEHHFYAVATDMAGNVEAKEPVSEFTLNVGTVIIKGDANGDGKVNISDAVAIVNYILGNPSASFHEAAADVNNDGKVTISDAVGVVNMILSGN